MLVRSIAAAMKEGPHSAQPIILNNVHPGLCESELDKDVKVQLKLRLRSGRN
jgi:retinol dehydrogenase-12